MKMQAGAETRCRGQFAKTFDRVGVAQRTAVAVPVLVSLICGTHAYSAADQSIDYLQTCRIFVPQVGDVGTTWGGMLRAT